MALYNQCFETIIIQRLERIRARRAASLLTMHVPLDTHAGQGYPALAEVRQLHRLWSAGLHHRQPLRRCVRMCMRMRMPSAGAGPRDKGLPPGGSPSRARESRPAVKRPSHCVPTEDAGGYACTGRSTAPHSNGVWPVRHDVVCVAHQ